MVTGMVTRTVRFEDEGRDGQRLVVNAVQATDRNVVVVAVPLQASARPAVVALSPERARAFAAAVVAASEAIEANR